MVKGEADLAVQAEHEIRCVKGATFLPYPAVFQRTIVFMGGVGTAAGDAAAAKAYLAFITGPTPPPPTRRIASRGNKQTPSGVPSRRVFASSIGATEQRLTAAADPQLGVQLAIALGAVSAASSAGPLEYRRGRLTMADRRARHAIALEPTDSSERRHSRSS